MVIDLSPRLSQLQLISATLNVQADFQVSGDSVGMVINNSKLYIYAIVEIAVNNFGIQMYQSIMYNYGRLDLIISIGALTMDLMSSCFNYSELIIQSGTSYGILNYGYIYNEELIDIASLTSDGIILEGTIQNDTDGSISIHDLTDSADGIFMYPNSELENMGLISIENISKVGMIAMGQLQNYGNIDLEDVQNGIILDFFSFIQNLSTLINHSSATIFIANTSTHGIFLGPMDSLNNMGKIEISDLYCTGLSNNGSVLNSDTLIINLAMTCSSINNDGLFNNVVGGVIEINDGNIGISNSKTFENSGQIEIKKSRRGIYNYGGLFQNNINASIQLDTITGHLPLGFQNWSDDEGFINAGNFSMNYIEGPAIQNYGKIHVLNSGNIIGTNLLGDKLISEFIPNIVMSITIDGVVSLE